MDIVKLKQFLDNANKNTYAADGGKSSPSRLGSEDLEYTEDDLTYHDTYFGNSKFIGEEIVYEFNIPVWGLNYYGWIEDNNCTSKEVYVFLKKSLLQTYEDIIPVRGPLNFTEGEWEYRNQVSGTMENVIGEEKIFKSGKLIYRAHYHGGLIVK